MSQEKVAVIILAAGMGTRMKSQRPKVLHSIAGRPMIAHLLQTVEDLAAQPVVVVVGPDMEAVTWAVAPHPTVLQQDRLGTGHAVLQAKDLLADFEGTVLVLYGDTPLITETTLRQMLDRRMATDQPAVVVLGFRPQRPAEYGRLVVGSDGLEAIVEYRDASPAQQAINLCNSGVMAIDSRHAWHLLAQIGNQNSKGEFYLTDLVGLARAAGLRCDFVEGSEEELLGVNSRAELAQAEAIAQQRLRRVAMAGGATMIDPSSVFLSWDTQIGCDVILQPHVVCELGVEIGDGVEIRSFSHLAGVTVAAGCVVGPFARLRPGAVIGEGAHIGNFVEIKNATVEAGVKVNHLSYIGDAHIGAGSNIGAGTVTCNYDGHNKHFTDIGAGTFIGSNSSLVAPVKIGDGAIVGAGSVITEDVSPDALAIGRGPQSETADGARRFHDRRRNGVSKKKL